MSRIDPKGGLTVDSVRFGCARRLEPCDVSGRDADVVEETRGLRVEHGSQTMEDASGIVRLQRIAVESHPQKSHVCIRAGEAAGGRAKTPSTASSTHGWYETSPGRRAEKPVRHVQRQIGRIRSDARRDGCIDGVSDGRVHSERTESVERTTLMVEPAVDELNRSIRLGSDAGRRQEQGGKKRDTVYPSPEMHWDLHFMYTMRALSGSVEAAGREYTVNPNPSCHNSVVLRQPGSGGRPLSYIAREARLPTID